MREELKPCPFCGYDVELEVNDWSGGEVKYFVTCRNEDCGAPPKTDYRTSKADTVRAWNQRAEPKEHQ